MPSGAIQWNFDVVSVLQDYIAETTAICLGYGFVSISAIIALYLPLRNGFPASPSGRLLLAIVLILFLSSTLEFAAHLGYIILGIASGPNNNYRSSITLAYCIRVCDRLNYIINDCVVVWRAWVLAGRDHVLIPITLATCLVATLACTIAESILIVKSGISTPIARIGNLLLFVPLLATNLIATGIIFYKTLLYRRSIKVHLNLDQKTKITQVERVLFFFIESGFIYCGWWTLFLVCVFRLNTIPYKLYDIVDNLSPFTAAIYPILIILVVEGQKNSLQLEHEPSATRSEPMRFAAAQASQATSLDLQGTSIIQSIIDAESSVQNAGTSRTRTRKSDVDVELAIEEGTASPGTETPTQSKTAEDLAMEECREE